MWEIVWHILLIFIQISVALAIIGLILGLIFKGFEWVLELIGKGLEYIGYGIVSVIVWVIWLPMHIIGYICDVIAEKSNKRKATNKQKNGN